MKLGEASPTSPTKRIIPPQMQRFSNVFRPYTPQMDALLLENIKWQREFDRNIIIGLTFVGLGWGFSRGICSLHPTTTATPLKWWKKGAKIIASSMHGALEGFCHGLWYEVSIPLLALYAVITWNYPHNITAGAKIYQVCDSATQTEDDFGDFTQTQTPYPI